MLEIETKIMDVNEFEVLAKLREPKKPYKGPFRTFDGLITVIHFNSPHALLRVRNEYCKVHNKNKIWITVKDRPLNDGDDIPENVKVLKEINLQAQADDFEEAVIFMEALGFTKKETIKKYRSSHSYYIRTGKRIKLEFDRFVGADRPWLEIEAPTHNLLKETLKKIGYSLKDGSSKTTEELYKMEVMEKQ